MRKIFADHLRTGIDDNLGWFSEQWSDQPVSGSKLSLLSGYFTRKPDDRP